MQVVNLKLWDDLNEKVVNVVNSIVIPYMRRILRFIALPYCYFLLVNWRECKRGPLKVAGDLLYIFFILKYYPDNYSLCRLWERDKGDWVYFYGSNYDPYQRRQLRKNVQKKEYVVLFEDKNVCYQLCKAGNLPLPKQYCFVTGNNETEQALRQIFKEHPQERIIVKPVGGKGGGGIVLCFMKNGKMMLKSSSGGKGVLSYGDDCSVVLQHCITQHEKLNLFSPSINTVRLATILTKENNVVIIGALMRFGVGENFVDNTSKGGVAVGINVENGLLMKWAYDFNSLRWHYHPTSQKEFLGFEIPFWDEIVTLAKKTQHYFNYFKLFGHDIAITANGPVIVELNAIYDNVHLEMCSGPILKNREVLREYGQYNLLINDKQRSLVEHSRD